MTAVRVLGVEEEVGIAGVVVIRTTGAVVTVGREQGGGSGGTSGTISRRPLNGHRGSQSWE